MQKFYLQMKRFLMGAAVAAVMALPLQANAAIIAVWADGTGGPSQANAFIESLGYTVVNVSDAQVATPGFLNRDDFSAIFVTRQGDGFGVGMSAEAAANTAIFVGPAGPNVVLFNNDATDNLPGATAGDPVDPNVAQLFANALAYVVAFGHGYLGEFNGAAMAYSANANGFVPLSLLAGDAGPLEAFNPALNTWTLACGTPPDILTTGFCPPTNFVGTDETTFRTVVTGLVSPPARIVATFADGAAAEVARVPEPTTLVLVLTGLLGLGLMRFRKA